MCVCVCVYTYIYIYIYIYMTDSYCCNSSLSLLIHVLTIKMGNA